MSLLITMLISVALFDFVAMISIATFQFNQETRWGVGVARPVVERWTNYSKKINHVAKLIMLVLVAAIIVTLAIQFIY